MNNHLVKVEGIQNLGSTPGKCSGEIEIVRENEKTVYATWRMNDENGQYLASVSREYFTGNKLSENELFKLILQNIDDYHIDREKIFSDLKLV